MLNKEKLELKIHNSKLQLIVSDITKQNTQAIVNAANKQLAPGGGVAGAIHTTAGPQLWEECRKLNGCQTGKAKITGAYNLPNEYIIHSVGPVYKGSKNDAHMLRNSYINCLKIAEGNNIESISFPAISTGAFGYPLQEAAKIALETIIEYLKTDTKIKLVRMVLHTDKAFDVHKKVLEEIAHSS